MNMSEFNAALGRYAVAHPERRLSKVTAIEFAEWYYSGSPHSILRGLNVRGESTPVVAEYPEPSELGPVPPGSTLVVGARYRITEVANCDFDPQYRVGDHRPGAHRVTDPELEPALPGLLRIVEIGADIAPSVLPE